MMKRADYFQKIVIARTTTKSHSVREVVYKGIVDYDFKRNW
jgi:hypothetical protein